MVHRVKRNKKIFEIEMTCTAERCVWNADGPQSCRNCKHGMANLSIEALYALCGGEIKKEA